ANQVNPVVFEGYKVGKVQSVELKPSKEYNFVVEILLSHDSFPIPKDSKAKIISSDIFGSKAIEIILGDSSAFALPGDTLISEAELGIAEAVKKELLPLKNKTDELINSVDDILKNLRAVFDDEATQGLPDAFASLENMMGNLERTSERLDNTVAENQKTLTSIFDNVESITGNLEANNEELNNVIGNFSTISDSLAKVDFIRTMNKADEALADFAEITEKINNGQGSISLFLNNDSLHNSLIDTNEELQYLLNDLYMNPWRYVHVSIFGKKPKEKYSKRELKQLRDLINEELEKEEPN
ncbi:MAG: MCE family protein, partial [Flavobacteriales bacterium]|nr:MCE family protein [Flavobacteriales bacterium]